MKSIKYVANKGFTLVELLIVVIIIAILASILVPQFSSSTDDAKLAALDGTLSNMRSAVDLYYQQHGDYPSKNLASGASCPAGGTAGTGAADSDVAFMDQMTMYTNAAGQACSTSDANFKYGPYLKKDTLPNNPFTDANALDIKTAGDLNMTGTAAPATGKGWQFDNITGRFIADHDGYDDR